MIFAVDFDGTLCEDKYPGIGEPNKLLIEELIAAKKSSYKLILWTCREGKELDEAVEWCREQGLEFDAVNDNLPEVVERFGGNNNRKIFAHRYIDDRAISACW